LTALITLVLLAVWWSNRQIPGLRVWTLSFLMASIGSVTILVRDSLPQVLSVVILQGSLAMAGYLCLLATRAYLGRRPISHAYAVVGIGALVLISLYFTLVEPNLGVRFVASGMGAGLCYVLTARTLLGGDMRQVPARYLFALVAGAHGLFLLVRPVLLTLALPSGGVTGDNHLASVLSQSVLLEALVAAVLLGFGTLVLANEHITLELRHLAEVDALTDVFNRRAFFTLLDKAVSSAQRSRSAVAVLLIDLDHFKNVNDTFGHRAGDAVLRHFTQLARQCLRNEDVMGRCGGEEFAVCLAHASPGTAVVVAERLRALVAATPLDYDGQSIALTVSIGITLGADVGSTSALLQRADEAMYLAKHRGRNRVELLELA
jgi:diguanylate cyclase (GGDEF)-like protein